MFRVFLALVAVATVTEVVAAADQTASPPYANRGQEYQSSFQSYRPFKDQVVAPWLDVNREVGRIGGHAGSVKSKADADRPAARSTAPNAPQGGPPTVLDSGHDQHH